MSGTYDGADVFPTAFTIPDDADPENASAVNVPFESLADRTVWLKNRAASAVANFAALIAITTPGDGWKRFIPGYGYYYFDAASSATAGAPYVFIPTDATPGRWLHELIALRNQTDGHAGLTGTKVDVLGTTNPTFKAGPRTRVISVSTHDFRIAIDSTMVDTIEEVNVDKESYFAMRNRGFQNITWQKGAIVFPPATGSITQAVGCSVCLDAYMHDGATLESVTLEVQAGSGHTAAPDHPISVGLFKQGHLVSGYLGLFSSGDFVEDPDGVTAFSGAYEGAHPFTATTDQNNVIDRQASYYLQLWNEWGNNMMGGGLVRAVSITLSGIVDMRFP